MAGRFVVLEGPEGAGKTSVARALAARLADTGREAVLTREPGGTVLGEQLRRVLLEAGGRAILPATEALLFAAARAQHVSEVIGPALARGAVVVCDRFVDSSLAYQAGGLGLPLSEVRAIQRLAVHEVRPDLRVLLDLPVADGLARRFDAGEPNRVDLADLAFHERVRVAYHDLVRADPAGWVVVDARQPLAAVADAAWLAVRRVATDAADGGDHHGPDGRSR